MQRRDLVKLEGRNLVLDTLKADRYINKIYIESSAKGERISKIAAAANDKNIEVEYIPRNELSKMSVTSGSQGVIALAEKIKTYTMKEFSKTLNFDNNCVLLLRDLDFEHNLGAIVRSCSGSGVSGVVVPKKRQSSITPLVERISQGGINDVPIIEESFYSSLKSLKKLGFRVIALETTADKFYFEEDLTGNVVFIFGNESETLDNQTLEKVDITVKIPMIGTVPSLNVSVACGITVYERLRQIKNK